MIKLETYHIQGHDDFELNIKRDSQLTYHIAYNNTKEPDGIIFTIPGFGGDAVVNYQKNLIKYIAKEFNLLAVFVEYHSIFSRLTKDKETASCQFGVADTEILINIINKLNIKLDENNLDTQSIINQISRHISQLKNQNIIDKNFRLPLFATLCPYKNEYQNFGVLQAIDILTVLYHIKSLGFSEIINKKPVIAIGSSHGGYLANLLMKFSPNTFDTIIDNSCYIKPPLNYIVGFEQNKQSPEFTIRNQNIDLSLFTLTNWTLQSNSPYQFNKSSYEIRDLSNDEQIKQLSNYNNKTNIISYHSTLDKISSYNDKKQYSINLSNYNYNYTLNTINSEDQIDGKLIKNLNHAMGMSIKELIKTTLPMALKDIKSTQTDICKQSTITYKTSLNDIYQFDFKDNTLEVNLIKSKI